MRPRALGPVATETLVRERLPAASAGFAHACHAVTGGNPFLLGALLTQLVADAVAPDDEAAARLGAFGSEQVARVVERQLARLPDGAGSLARAVAVLGPGAPLRHAAGLARLELAEAARAADALRAAGLLDGRSGADARAPADRGNAVREPAGRRAGAPARGRRRAARERARRPRAHRAAPAAHRAGRATRPRSRRCATRRGGPARAALRRARRPTCAARSPSRRRTPPRTPTCGSSWASRSRPTCTRTPTTSTCCTRRSPLAATPDQRGAIALSGARALGLIGRFDRAVALCRQALEQRRGVSGRAARAARGGAQLQRLAARVDDRGVAPLRPRSPAGAFGARAVAGDGGACAACSRTGRRPRPCALLRPVLEQDALAAEPGSLLSALATLHLIADDELETALAQCDALIDVARPRGWLIALAHGSMFRAMALVRAGEIRDAEADARLAFEYKLPVAPGARDAVVPVVPRRRARGGGRPRRRRRGADRRAPTGGAAGRRARRAAAAAGPRAAAAGAAPARRTPSPTRGRPAPVPASSACATPVFASWRAEAVEALVVRGEVAEARRLAREQLELGEQLGTPGARGAALRVLARTATEPIPLLERAVEMLAGSPARLEHTRALVDLGAALRRANRRADARAPLRRALEQADRSGMRLLARRAREELNAAGARPRRSALSGPGALTPAEHRVAELAAQRARQPRDRRAAVRDAAHRRDAPHARLPEARHRLARRARRRPRAAGRSRRARAGRGVAATACGIVDVICGLRRRSVMAAPLAPEQGGERSDGVASVGARQRRFCPSRPARHAELLCRRQRALDESRPSGSGEQQPAELVASDREVGARIHPLAERHGRSQASSASSRRPSVTRSRPDGAADRTGLHGHDVRARRQQVVAACRERARRRALRRRRRRRIIVVVQPRFRGVLEEAARRRPRPGRRAAAPGSPQLACQLRLAGEATQAGRSGSARTMPTSGSSSASRPCAARMHHSSPTNWNSTTARRCAGLARRLGPADAQRLGVREPAGEQRPRRFPLEDHPVRDGHARRRRAPRPARRRPPGRRRTRRARRTGRRGPRTRHRAIVLGATRDELVGDGQALAAALRVHVGPRVRAEHLGERVAVPDPARHRERAVRPSPGARRAGGCTARGARGRPPAGPWPRCRLRAAGPTPGAGARPSPGPRARKSVSPSANVSSGLGHAGAVAGGLGVGGRLGGARRAARSSPASRRARPRASSRSSPCPTGSSWQAVVRAPGTLVVLGGDVEREARGRLVASAARVAQRRARVHEAAGRVEVRGQLAGRDRARVAPPARAPPPRARAGGRAGRPAGRRRSSGARGRARTEAIEARAGRTSRARSAASSASSARSGSTPRRRRDTSASNSAPATAAAVSTSAAPAGRRASRQRTTSRTRGVTAASGGRLSPSARTTSPTKNGLPSVTA